MPPNDDKEAPIVSNPSQAFERWIRGAFVAMNSELENLYFAEADRANVEGVGTAIKAALRDEGHAHVIELWREGNTGDGFESGFSVLGNVGMYLAALRRHELTNPAREQRSPFVEASSLAMHVGASIGMAPRFATAHLSTHNRAIEGVRKSFTNLADEFLFIDENTRGILCFQRAAEELHRSVKLGVSNPVSELPFNAAADALTEAIAVNERLFSTLNVDRFFYSVCPITSPIGSGGLNIVAPMPVISQESMKLIYCWDSVKRAIRTMRNYWLIKCNSWFPMINNACGSVCGIEAYWMNFCC